MFNPSQIYIVPDLLRLALYGFCTRYSPIDNDIGLYAVIHSCIISLCFSRPWLLYWCTAHAGTYAILLFAREISICLDDIKNWNPLFTILWQICNLMTSSKRILQKRVHSHYLFKFIFFFLSFSTNFISHSSLTRLQ